MRRKEQSGESERPPQSAPEPAEPHFVVTAHPFDLKRFTKIAGAVLATGATFILATAGGVALHVGLPPARRLAAAAVNEILTGTFRGKLDVVRLSRLAPNGVDGGVVALTDPDGNRVALLEGVHARIALFPLLASLLSGGDTRVRVTELSIDHIDALLAQTADGSLTIAQAFQPAKEEPPPPPAKKTSGLDLTLPRIVLKHAWVHGGMSALPLIDTDLDDLVASFTMTPDTTSAEVRRLRLSTRGMPKGADIGANLEAHLVLPADAAKMNGSVVFVGTVGGIDVGVRGGIDGKQVDATVDVARVVPSQLDRLLGQSPVHQTASAHIEAHGLLPHVDPLVHLTIGEGTVDLRGTVTVPTEGQSDTLARFTVAARDLDARAASLSAPASKLGLDASATARLSADGVADGTYDVHILPGRLGAQAVPAAHIAGTFAPTAVRGEARVDEPGAPSVLQFNVNPLAEDGPDIAFDASVRARDISRVPQLGASMRGRATVHAAGTVALGSKRVNARVETTLDGFSEGSISVEHADVTASVKGTFANPTAVAALDGRGLRAGGYAYPFFNAVADGTPDDVHADANLRGGNNPVVRAAATFDLASGVAARDVAVSLTREKDTVTARIASATAKGGRVNVAGIRFEGAGEPLEGELHLRPGSIVARATASRVNIPTLLRIAGVAGPMRSGDVALDIDVRATKRTTIGRVNATLHQLTYGAALQGLDATMKASFDGERADLHVAASDGARESLTVDADNAHLDGGALDPHAWERATGRLRTVASLDLHRLKEETGAALPVDERASGRLNARVDLTRDDAKRRPSVVLDASTRNLAVTTQPKTAPGNDHTVVVVGRALHSEGMDAHATASFDGESGKAALDAFARDQVGKLVEASASGTLPINAILGGNPRDALLATPMRAHVEMPLRSISAIPQLLGTVPARGDLGFTLDAEGSARAPHVQALIHARNITDADDPSPIPISFDAAAIYDGLLMRAKVVAFKQAAQVLDVTADVALKADAIIAGNLAWEANGDAALTKFPIGALTGFADENAIDGDLSGKVSLRGLHKAGALDANLDLANIEINGAKFGDTTASANVRDGSLAANVRIAQLDGFADVHLAGGMGWGEATAPSVDETKPIDVTLQAKNFRLAMFAPFIRSAVSELDGRLNANTKLHVVPGMKDGTMDGAIVVNHGLFETPTIGEEFHDLKARIFMKPWGVWNVAEISADGTSGHFTASALAHVSGIHFRSGEAHLRIAERDKLPLTMQGTELGTVWGQVDATAALTGDGKTVGIQVRVPNLHVGLPDSIGHAVQSTSPDETIKVGSIEEGGVVAILPVDGSLPLPAPEQPKGKASDDPPLKLHVTTTLGPDFEVRRNAMLRAYITQGPTIDIGAKTAISGAIAIPRGYVELQGKRFQIENGTVTFTGQEPDNPVVVATAAYDSPDGTKVLADFIGPVKTGKLTLRSEPQLSQNEILALLLFGSADGTFGQGAPPGQQGNDGTQAASLAGGVVTEGLNKAISGVSGVEVQTKVDTQDSGDPRPEVEVALSRDVSATIVYNLGVPPPGQNPDDTLLVADWRFHRNYSAEATLGDKGTSILDLTWKYRY